MKKTLSLIAPLALLGLSLAGCSKTSNQQASLLSPSDYRARHPIMVSSRGASLPHRCGQWPEDLGANSITAKFNEPHWNHGCSTQNNLSAMVANPNDLLKPRAMGPSDAARRNTIIERYRNGQDTTTNWKSEDKNKVQLK